MTSKQPDTLLVIVPDRLSVLIDKGEITPRYYNPGNLFKNVHILTCTDDCPDPAALQPTVGDATLQIHTLPLKPKFVYTTLGFQIPLLKQWAHPAIVLAKAIKPDMIRCHGIDLNLFVGAYIKDKTGIPLIASLHNGQQTLGLSLKDKLIFKLMEPVKRWSLKRTDIAAGVYSPAKRALKKLGAQKVEIAYNAVFPDGFTPKTDYSLSTGQFRLLYVGQIIEHKNPGLIIQAIQDMPDVTLDIYGSGTHVPEIEQLIRDLDCGERVKLCGNINNTELKERMTSYDAFVNWTAYLEIPKTMLEASLCAMPVITNKPVYGPVDELDANAFYLTGNTADSYRHAINTLKNDESARQTYGRNAARLAQENWPPEQAEQYYVKLYRQLLNAAA